jgi:arginine utilization regulatory protein
VQFLEKLDYRGNVRELENRVTEVLVSKNSHNGNLTLQDFRDHFSQEGALESPPASQLTLKGYLKSMEKKRIVEILKNRLNNITLAAQDLGISRQNLQYRLKKLHIGLGVVL